MKKTLLALALVGVASTSFANVSLYSTDSSNFYANGELKLDYKKSSKKTTDYTTKTTTVSREKTKVSQAPRVRLGFGYDFKNADTLTAGFYVRYQTEGKTTTTSTKAAGEAAYKQAPKQKAKFGEHLELNKAYVYLGHSVFGKVTVGNRMDTVVGDTFEMTSGFAGTNSFYDTAFRSEAKLDNATTVRYDAPAYEGFNFAYSYSNADSSSRLHAYQLSYDFGGTKVFGTAAFKKAYSGVEGYQSSEVSNKVKAFEVAAVNTDLVENLALAAAYSHVKSEKPVYKTGTESKTSTNELVAKAAYTYNQYFKPYAGVGYKKEAKTDGDVKSSTKTYSFGLGAASTVFQMDSYAVNLYAQGAYVKAKNKTGSKVTSRVKTKEFQLGATASF